MYNYGCIQIAQRHNRMNENRIFMRLSCIKLYQIRFQILYKQKQCHR